MEKLKKMVEGGNQLEKKEAVALVEELVFELGLRVVEVNTDKPWGAYWRFDGGEAEKFVGQFFATESKETVMADGEISPKFLLVAPGSRLSWQYHRRRSELWRVIVGDVGVKTSVDAAEPEEVIVVKAGELLFLPKGECHRLIGFDGWGLVAEIWRHEDVNNLSDESDIVRLQDDYSRT